MSLLWWLSNLMTGRNTNNFKNLVRAVKGPFLPGQGCQKIVKRFHKVKVIFGLVYIYLYKHVFLNFAKQATQAAFYMMFKLENKDLLPSIKIIFTKKYFGRQIWQ